MGGGGVMKSAAKVFGYTVLTGGLRGVTAAENCPVPLAGRKVASSCTVPVGTSSPDHVKQVVLQSQHDLHDWEFAGAEEDLISGEPMKRIVFGGLPTLQEAKEATSELTLAVEKAYLSSPGYGGSVISDHDSTSSLSNSNLLETRNVSEKCVAPAEPTSAIQAFKLLSRSPEVQNVVASLACDQNVWNAAVQNTELQKLLQSQETCLNFLATNMNLDAKESVANYGQENPEAGNSKPGNGFQDFVQKMKLAVVDMMSNLSEIFQSLFSQAANKLYVNADGTARLNGAEAVVEASIFGLAVMAIMVILLKRC